MQRSMYSARALEEGLHHVIDFGIGGSPRRKEAWKQCSLWRSMKKHGIYAIPVIVLLSLLLILLWTWYSYPEKDGQIMVWQPLIALNDTLDYEHTLLALASPTNVSIPGMKNKAEVKSVSPAD